MAEVNQQMIADKLGLSKATVSRCFTNHAGISPATRARVFQLAAEIGYKHLENRSPAARTKTHQPKFSVLICSETEEYFRGGYQSPGEEILAGVSEYAQIHHIKMGVHFIPPTVTGLDDPIFRQIKELRSKANRGVLLIYPFPGSFVEQLAEKLPLVSLVEQQNRSTVDCVDVNHYHGISAVIDHLVEAGHTRIGFYTKDYAIDASWSYRRYGAFVEKMARLRLKIQPKDVVGIFPRNFPEVAEGIQAAAHQTRSGVTAWICAADHQAYDLIAGFKKEDLHVPRDVSVTGFDGIGKSSGTFPSLTTVEIPFRAIGMTGAERLAARIRKRFGGEQRVYISGNLRPGKTVGKASS